LNRAGFEPITPSGFLFQFKMLLNYHFILPAGWVGLFLALTAPTSATEKPLKIPGYKTSTAGKGLPRNIIGQWPEDEPSVYTERVNSDSDPKDLEVIRKICEAHDVLISHLKELGLYDIIVVVFNSAHQERGKNTCYEGALVPFILRLPGVVREGKRNDALVVNIDLVATFIEMAGRQAEPDMLLDGKSLVSLLKGERDSHHPFVFLEMDNTWALVTDHWKLIQNRVPEYRKVGNTIASASPAFASILRDHGYRTGLIGEMSNKHHYGLKE
jgi:hypothetical protein